MWRAVALMAMLVVSGCSRTRQAPATPAAAATIAWRPGTALNEAFAEAKATRKPVLLLWSARWCPPCNALKATLFKDPAFIAETREFVPVYLDGDDKGAQGWGERFGIAGYPTMIILSPDGREITRLASVTVSSFDAMSQAMRASVRSAAPIDDLLAKAKANPSALGRDEWALLANYDWLNDPKRFAAWSAASATLSGLAAAAPDPALSRRFALLSLATAGGSDPAARLSGRQRADLVRVLPAILAVPDEVRGNREILSEFGAELVGAAPDTASRDMMARRLVAALDRVYADGSLPIADRLQSTSPALALATANGGKVLPALLAEVRARVRWADAAAKSPQERQSVIGHAGELLDAAGDTAGAVRLIEAELPRAEAPNYYMTYLANFAETRKDVPSAVTWSRRAWQSARGPASKLQWGVMYANTVLRLVPDDHAAVAAAGSAVVDAVLADRGIYVGNGKRMVDGWTEQLHAWSGKQHGGEVIAILDQRLRAACQRGGWEQPDRCPALTIG